MAVVKEKQSALIKKAIRQYEDLKDTVAVIEAMRYEKETGSSGTPWKTLKKKIS